MPDTADRSLRYVIDLAAREGHRVQVCAEFTAREALPEPFELALPVWSPGSYLVREYSRHVDTVRATVNGDEVGVRKVRKNAWAIAHGGARALRVTWWVYAHELGVRSAHVDADHAFLHGPALYLFPLGEPAWARVPVRLALHLPEASWQVSTSLTAEGAQFHAADYDELLDAPVHAGPHPVLHFEAAGRPHSLSVYGLELANAFDEPRLVAALRRIIAHEAAFFGGLPQPQYAIHLLLAPGQRGGLEHRNATAIVHTPEVFASEEGWADLLALFAHEYLHLWHVRRVIPAGLASLDYERENYTRALWLFEGTTSYYDWLFLRRAGLVDVGRYLGHLGADLLRLESTPGRAVTSLEDASFDAWTRQYRPGEDTPNRSVSYYLKGSLVSLLLDLTIRDRSGGERSLDDVMRWLWAEHGISGRAFPEEAFEAAVAEATDVDVSDCVEAWVRGTDELPVDEVLGLVGLRRQVRAGEGASLGLRTRTESGRVIVGTVWAGGAAARAGVAPGDELIALGGRRLGDAESLRTALRRRHPGEALELLVARRERMLRLEVRPEPAPPTSIEIIALPGADARARARARQWIGDEVSSLWRTS